MNQCLFNILRGELFSVVLAHPNIKLFVTQGGLQSLDEAIYNEVPLVVIPFFGDQEQNAKMVRSKGIAVIVEVRPYLDKDKLQTAMLEVTNSTKYVLLVAQLNTFSHILIITDRKVSTKQKTYTCYFITSKITRNW